MLVRDVAPSQTRGICGVLSVRKNSFGSQVSFSLLCLVSVPGVDAAPVQVHHAFLELRHAIAQQPIWHFDHVWFAGGLCVGAHLCLEPFVGFPPCWNHYPRTAFLPLDRHHDGAQLVWPEVVRERAAVNEPAALESSARCFRPLAVNATSGGCHVRARGAIFECVINHARLENVGGEPSTTTYVARSAFACADGLDGNVGGC